MNPDDNFKYFQARLDSIDHKVDKLLAEVSQLKLKASWWGAWAGLGTALGVVLWKFLLG